MGIILRKNLFRTITLLLFRSRPMPLFSRRRAPISYRYSDNNSWIDGDLLSTLCVLASVLHRVRKATIFFAFHFELRCICYDFIIRSKLDRQGGHRCLSCLRTAAIAATHPLSKKAWEIMVFRVAFSLSISVRKKTVRVTRCCQSFWPTYFPKKRTRDSIRALTIEKQGRNY